MKTTAILFLIFASFTSAYAQGTAADYERANGLRAKYEAAAIDIAGTPTWIGNTHRFWYRKLSRGANEYVIYDVDTLKKQPAFDHEKIAASLSKLTSNTYKPQDLSLAQLRFDNSVTSFNATIDGTAVRCTIADSACTKVDVPDRHRLIVRSRSNHLTANGKHRSTTTTSSCGRSSRAIRSS